MTGLTATQRRLLASLGRGGLVRRRGAFGDHQAEVNDTRFASCRTIDALVRKGMLRPAEWWGSFERTEVTR
jgi:hypothetical protein